MPNFIKIKPSDISLDPSKKILKAQDYAAFVESEELLKASERRAKEQEEKATAALTGMMQKSMHDISEKIKAEKIQHSLETTQASILHLKKLEQDLVNLVMSSVRKIIDDYSDEERIYHVVKSGLKLLCQTEKVSVRVHPETAPALLERLNKLKQQFEHIDIYPDEKLNKDDCIIESELGIINASLENQIANLEKSISSVIAA